MIKLFVSDFDGTLLDEMHTLSDETTEAIHALRESGVSFMPASGRDYTAIQQILEPIGVKVKCIALNGGEFFDNQGNVKISYAMDNETAKTVHTILNQYDVVIDYYCDDGRYSQVEKNVKAIYLDYYMRSSEKTMAEILHLFEDLDLEHVIQSESDIDKIIEHGVIKMEAQFIDLKERMQCMEELRQIKRIDITSSYGKNLEILNSKATKGDMVESVCEMYGYKKEEVLVIGDNFNDITMLSRFPNSYAMGNAVDEIKEVANYQADTNRHHGVAKVMYEVIERNRKEREANND